MPLPDGYHQVEPGRLASVATYLEMLDAPTLPARPLPPDVEVRQVTKPDPDWYRALFRSIGERWLWFSRLAMPDAELATILSDPLIEVYTLSSGDSECGLLELDFRQPPDVELSFLGVTPAAIGSGFGSILLEFAIRRAWRDQPRRFWLHTCTLDHPSALGFYMRYGFKPYMRAIEITPDPRLTGILPRDAALQVPIIESSTSK